MYDSEGCYYDRGAVDRAQTVVTLADAILKLRAALQEILDLPLGAFASEGKGIATRALLQGEQDELGGVTPY